MRLSAKCLCILFLAIVAVGTAAAEGRQASAPTPVFTMAAFLRLLPSTYFDGEATKTPLHSSVADGKDQFERATIVQTACLALAIYHEARGESLPAQRAVAATIINRAKSSAYPATLCGVVYDKAWRPQKCQFSFACDGRSDVPRDHRAVAVSMKIAIETAVTDASGLSSCSELATHYHRHDVTPVWSKELRPLGRVGAHLFFASDRVIRRMDNASVHRNRVSQCTTPDIALALTL